MLRQSCQRVACAARRGQSTHLRTPLRTSVTAFVLRREATLRSPLEQSSRASARLRSTHHRGLCSAAIGGSSSPTDGEPVLPPGVESPGDKFVMLYTCTVCETRAAKTISKHAYHNGVVLVRCPGCENLHLIADRLGWFEDDSTDVESLLAAKGEQIQLVTHEDVLELTDRDLLNKSRE